ncbi:uncharacterized protein ACWYII_030224 isoform 2-T4 [Salvelinus alpinus]
MRFVKIQGLSAVVSGIAAWTPTYCLVSRPPFCLTVDCPDTRWLFWAALSYAGPDGGTRLVTRRCLLLNYHKISAPLVEVLVSAVFGKSSLAAEVLLCWWSGKLSYTGKPSCTPVWSARKWDVSLELGKTRPSLFNPVTVLMYK